MITITEKDLLAIITKADLTSLAKRQTEEAGESDPIASAITKELATIQLWVNPQILPDDMLRKIWVLLVVASFYNRLSVIPPKRIDEKKEAMTLLKDIRDGKFPSIPVDTALIPSTTRCGLR